MIARRLWAVLVCVLGIVALLLITNDQLFKTAIIEDGDGAANSLLIRDLPLVAHGHYSRIGFYHPGPFLLDMQWAGELVFYRWLHLVPAPYNGQVIAVVLFNAACYGLCLWVVSSWIKGWHAVPAAALAILGTLGAVPIALSSAWFPYVFVAPFLLLVVASASAAAGRPAHLWIVALAAGILVHAHVSFAMFAVILGGWSLIGLRTGGVVPRRPALPADDAPPAGERGADPDPTADPSGGRAGTGSPRRHLIAAALVLLAFALPVLYQLALNFPDPVRQYLGYSAGDRPLNPPAEVLRWLSPSLGLNAPVWLVLVLWLAAAGMSFALLRRCPLPAVLVATTLIATLLAVVYSVKGVDRIQDTYTGIFTMALTVAVAVAGVTALASLSGDRLVSRLGWSVAAVVVVVLVAVSGHAENDAKGQPSIVTTAHALSQPRVTPGQAVVMHVSIDSWVDDAGVILELEREGVPVCYVTDIPSLRVLFTAHRECTDEQRRTGLAVDPNRSQTPETVAHTGGTHYSVRR